MQNDFPKWNNFVQQMKGRETGSWRGKPIKRLHGAHSASERVIKREGRVIWLMSRRRHEKQVSDKLHT